MLGIRRSTAMRDHADQITAAIGHLNPDTLPIASPWSTSNLQQIIATDVFGTDLPPVTSRSAAMRLPAVVRARNLIVSTLAPLPLAAATTAGQVETPTWMTRTDHDAGPQQRLAWTVDDLIFYGWSCWWRENGADGYPIRMGRVNRDDWTINADHRVEIRGTVQPDNAVVLIPGLHEGLLCYGRDVLSDAASLYRTVRQRIENPAPQVELHQTGGRQLTETEIDALIDRWSLARTGKNGGVGYTSADIELREHGSGSAELLIEARNAAAVDLARMIGVTASRVDATAPKASLNYETTSGRNQEFIDFDLALYMTPITARLSMDDVMPRGQRATFDTTQLTSLTPAATGPALED